MPRRSTLTLSGRAVDALAVSARDVIVWDRELAGFGVRVYPSGPQGLRRPKPGGWRATPRHPRHPRRDHRNPGTQARSPGHRPHQAGRGTRSTPAPGRHHRRRPRRALHERPRRTELQCAHRRHLPGLAGEPHPAGARHDAAWPGRARPRLGAALPPARDTPRRQPGAGGPLQDVLARRRLGPRAGRHQPLPRRPQIQREKARALPLPRGVPALRPGPGRSGGRGGRRGRARSLPTPSPHSASSCSPAAA